MEPAVAARAGGSAARNDAQAISTIGGRHMKRMILNGLALTVIALGGARLHAQD